MREATIESFRAELIKLVNDFQANAQYYNGDEYDESALRNGFLNNFWRALGWDLDNLPRKSQQLRDVQLETRVHIAGRNKKADYIFRTDGLDRFVCEAKRPKEGLSSSARYQAQRYAFNLGLYIGILTDFQQLKVFIVGGKPDPENPFRQTDGWDLSNYVEEHETIWNLLSYQAVASNSLDRYVAKFDKLPIKDKARQGWLVKLPRRMCWIPSSWPTSKIFAWPLRETSSAVTTRLSGPILSSTKLCSACWIESCSSDSARIATSIRARSWKTLLTSGTISRRTGHLCTRA